MYSVVPTFCFCKVGVSVKTVFIGGGHGCKAVLEMYVQDRLKVLDLDVLAVVDRNMQAPGMVYARELKLRTLGSIDEAMAMDGLELLIELTGRDDILEEIYRKLPTGVRVLDHVVARVFWDLENANTNLQEILDTIPDVVMVMDSKKRIVRVNRRFVETTGKSMEDVLGSTCQDFLCLGIDQLPSSEHRKAFDVVMITGHPYTVVTANSEKPGGKYFQITAHPLFDDSGKVAKVVQTSREITEQVRLKKETEESERRLRQIIDAVHGVITIKDLMGRYWLVNPRAQALYGLAQEQMLGKTDEELFDEDVSSIMKRNDQHALEKGGHHLTEEKLRFGNKECVLISERMPLTDYTGDLMGLCLVARDVTKELELQHELVSAERLAAVGKLAAGVAHELNNPLTGILTFAEDLLEETDEDDPRKSDYEMIVNETLRCRRIVQDLLDYSRRRAPESYLAQLNDIVRRTLGMVERQASFHNVEFSLQLADDLPKVELDPNQIQQAILNLVINARDAMDANGKIRVRTSMSPDGTKVFLEVYDTGCGIAEDQVARIFEPFYSTKGDRGNGLGLPAVSSVMEQHGGSVEVESELGSGSMFRLVFPVNPQ